MVREELGGQGPGAGSCGGGGGSQPMSEYTVAVYMEHNKNWRSNFIGA